jgi:hypothetical protein
MDHRDTARDRRWWNSINENRMTANVTIRTEDDAEEEVDVAVRFEVCQCCDGKGKYVNPNIDRHGLSREDFDQDPDFAEAYMEGQYDITCEECEGRRVVPVCMDEKVLEKIQEKARADAEYRAECEAERRMGA